MQSAMPPTLDYVRDRRFPVYLARVLAGLSVYPWLALLAIHAIYFAEWSFNGRRPIPPDAGPGNPAEDALYRAAGLLLLGLGPALLVQVGVVAVYWFNGEMDGKRPQWPLRLTLAVVVLPAASWFLAFVLLAADPFRAMYFYAD